jgi:hypothetical protein
MALARLLRYLAPREMLRLQSRFYIIFASSQDPITRAELQELQAIGQV